MECVVWRNDWRPKLPSRDAESAQNKSMWHERNSTLLEGRLSECENDGQEQTARSHEELKQTRGRRKVSEMWNKSAAMKMV